MYLSLIGVYILMSNCNAASRPRDSIDSTQLHKHGDSDLDFVQCHHAFYRINQQNGKPELVNGQESRVDPARQYLPQTSQPSSPPIEEKDPAASFDQPNFLSVENTFVSPTLQNNYNNLFRKTNKQEPLAPSAAQNVPTSLFPAAPRKGNDNKHGDEDDEDNLERLCNDAFHSFLCKPIKGPRKTPTGRLRENAVLPPGIFAGQPSNQAETKLRPENNKLPSRFSTVKYSKPPSTFPPIQPNPSNEYSQRLPFSSTLSSTTQKQPTTVTTQPPFINIYKNDKPDNPTFPSPSNNNPQFLKPQASNEVPLKTSAQTNGYFYEKPKVPFPPQVGYPSNPNPQVIYTQRPTTTYRPTTPKPKPTTGYSYDRPNIPFPSNNVLQIAKPPQPKIALPHDCDKHNVIPSPLTANPSHQSPAFIKPFTPTTQKPINKFSSQKPITPYASNNSPSYVFPKLNSPQTNTHDCDKQKLPFSSINSSPSNQNNAVFKPIEIPKVSSPSNNIAQIIAQPQQIKSVTITPDKPSGYFYEKPAIPFPPPTTSQRPFTFQPTTKKPTNGYVYDQPRIPFPSNNVAQIISQPTTTRPFPTTTVHSHITCEHDKSPSLSSSEVSNPTNQNVVVLKPSLTGNSYVYDKPNVPFPPNVYDPTNQSPQQFNPFVTTTQKPLGGYNYDKPSNQFLLPNPTNNHPTIITSSTNDGYTYQKPQKPFSPQSSFPSNNNQLFINPSQPSSTTFKPFPTSPKPFNGYSYDQPKVPFPSNINSKITLLSDNKPNYIAKPQTQIEVTAKPGYSYNKPASPFVSPQPTNLNGHNNGYYYPKPLSSFIR